MTLPDKEAKELAAATTKQLKQYALDAGMNPDVADAWSAARSKKYQLTTEGKLLHVKSGLNASERLAEIKVKKPGLFVTSDSSADTSTNEFKPDYALEMRAFGQKSVTARGQIHKALGGEKANERAIAWGLNSLHDYKTIGSRPANEAAPVDKPAGKPVTRETRAEVDALNNPWSAHPKWTQGGRYTAAAMSAQGQKIKALGEQVAGELAAAHGSKIGSTGPGRWK
jgi:hypothetical protein